MASILTEERFVSIPSEVTVKLEGKILTVKGPLGELKKDFSHAKVHIELVGDKIVVKSLGSKRTDKAIVGTISTHIKNMVKGCLLYTSPSPRDLSTSRMPSSA